MAKLVLLNKPYGVLSQFRDTAGRNTLRQLVPIPGVYPAGRLDYDSEGLLLLTDNGALQARIANPKYKTVKRYVAQVDGAIHDTALHQLTVGVQLSDGYAAALAAQRVDEPDLPPRIPPPRVHGATSWVEVSMIIGRNRIVRRLLAATGFPVLRLVRISIGTWSLRGLRVGEHRVIEMHAPQALPRTGRGKGRRH